MRKKTSVSNDSQKQLTEGLLFTTHQYGSSSVKILLQLFNTEVLHTIHSISSIVLLHRNPASTMTYRDSHSGEVNNEKHTLYVMKYSLYYQRLLQQKRWQCILHMKMPNTITYM